MAKFKYIATTPEGKEVSGVREAGSRDEVANVLHSQGLVVISIQENFQIDWQKLANIQIGGVPLTEKVAFTKQLYTMLSAGLPVIQALEILVSQIENRALKDKLQAVYSNISGGMSMSEAFAAEDVMFNNLQINLIKAGEASGNLNEILGRIATDMEKSKQLSSKISGAMIYPAVILVVLAIVIIAMLVFMIPTVEDMYGNFKGAQLPGPTLLLVNMSNFITSPVGAVSLLLVVVFGVLGMRYYYSTPGGRKVIDKLALKVPVFGQLQTKIQLTEFNRLLSMLLQSGVPIVESMRIVAMSLSNVIFTEAINSAVLEITKGNSITIPLAKSGVFPVMMLKMLATGEQTGQIDKITGDMGKYYEQEVDEVTNNLTKLMEPLIMVVVGGVVAFLAVAIYLPIYQLGQLSQ